MGREASAIVHWKGAATSATLLLEATELILRGGMQARIPRSSISDVSKGDGYIQMIVAGAPLIIELSGPQADGWVRGLTVAPPDLRSKLGISADRRAFVVGSVEDEALASALAGATTGALAEATVIVAILKNNADLESALGVARGAPNLGLWCVHGKGKHAGLGEATIRGALRASGYIDTKTSAVSSGLTATRYSARSAKDDARI